MIGRGYGRRVDALRRIPGVVPKDIPFIEAAALAALYKATSGPGWTNKTNWLQTPVADDWHGVTVAGGHVTQINLNTNNLVGTIPAAIGNLTSLITLYLYTNSLSGAIPTAIGNLTSLVWLFLNGNSLSGAIPTEIGNLSRLTQLGLSGNSLDLSGNFVAGLFSIQFLYMENNGWTQAESNALLDDIYAAKDNYTYASGIVLQMHGTNTAPSGTYQDNCPPTTQKEKAFELVNDNCGNGHNVWAITMT